MPHLYHIQAEDFINAVWDVVWKDPIYELEFDDEMLKSLKHKRTNAMAAIDGHCIVTSAWKLDFAWSEMRACFGFPPFSVSAAPRVF